MPRSNVPGTARSRCRRFPWVFLIQLTEGSVLSGKPFLVLSTTEAVSPQAADPADPAEEVWDQAVAVAWDWGPVLVVVPVGSSVRAAARAGASYLL
jgi:hypothetical protein